MSAMKQPAVTKHPKGTATFCFRVRTADGATWEAVSTNPLPIADVIATLKNEYLSSDGYLSKLSQSAEPAATEQGAAGF